MCWLVVDSNLDWYVLYKYKFLGIDIVLFNVLWLFFFIENVFKLLGLMFFFLSKYNDISDVLFSNLYENCLIFDFEFLICMCIYL